MKKKQSDKLTHTRQQEPHLKNIKVKYKMDMLLVTVNVPLFLQEIKMYCSARSYRVSEFTLVEILHDYLKVWKKQPQVGLIRFLENHDMEYFMEEDTDD